MGVQRGENCCARHVFGAGRSMLLDASNLILFRGDYVNYNGMPVAVPFLRSSVLFALLSSTRPTGYVSYYSQFG